MTMRRTISATLAIAAGLLLAGCGGGSEAGGSESEASTARGQETSEKSQKAALPGPMKAFSGDGDVRRITIEGTDQMKYSVEQFTVRPGRMIRLKLKHVGSLPVSAMGHNVVIIQRGEDHMEFTADVNEQGANLDNHYLPPVVYDRVIAFTEMVGGGESTTVEFRAPQEAGDYPYLCTFPGHAVQMNGTMKVEKQ